MGIYTDSLEYKGKDIYPEDEEYFNNLASFMKNFRNIDKALDEFIRYKGYKGDIDDIDAKILFIRMHFEQASIDLPRNIRKWYMENKRFTRKTAFKFCFAFQLNIMETEDFFRRICLQRGFDCHDVEEAVYYYAIKNNFSYLDARQIIDEIPEVSKSDINVDEKILYTDKIIEKINEFQNKKELLTYFQCNYKYFTYNNATAYKYIQNLWEEISGENGLAAKEKKVLLLPDKKKIHVMSIWRIYLQILGINMNATKVLISDRSIKYVLKENRLLHPLAEEAFPDRESIWLIINGKHVSYERVRKTLILLVFYMFWINISLKLEDSTYRARIGDYERCLDEINRYLIDSGYPELYVGNPYDWIFMYAAQDDYPLATFREYMNELFIYKQCSP